MGLPNSSLLLPAVRHTERSRKRNLILTIVFVGVLVISTPVVTWYLASVEGQTAYIQAASSLLALIPLAFVVWALHIIDRWEPEPLLIKVATVLWGGIGAILVTLAIVYPLTSLLIDAGILRSEEQLTFYSAVVQAPIVEEFAKAIPLLFLFLFMRKQIDGPIDGMVIAGLSAAGFAFTENIQYFSGQLIDSGDASFIFVMRGIMSPLTHAIFTAMGFGLMFGLIAHRSRWWALLMFPAGWTISTLLHALWNGSAVILGQAFFLGYFFIQVPIAVGSAVVIVLLFRSEARLTRARLTEYASAGWLSFEEAHRLSSGDGRMQLVRWAKSRGIRGLMVRYIQAATRLAFNRQRAVVGRTFRESQGQEADSLALFSSLRQELLARSRGDLSMGSPGGMLPSPVGRAHFGGADFGSPHFGGQQPRA